MGDPARTLTLYGRKDCHLCDDMALSLGPLATEWGFEVIHVDVDSEPDLVARHGADIPVLVHGDTPLCRHFLDAPRVRAYLARIR